MEFLLIPAQGASKGILGGFNDELVGRLFRAAVRERKRQPHEKDGRAQRRGYQAYGSLQKEVNRYLTAGNV